MIHVYESRREWGDVVEVEPTIDERMNRKHIGRTLFQVVKSTFSPC